MKLAHRVLQQTSIKIHAKVNIFMGRHERCVRPVLIRNQAIAVLVMHGNRSVFIGSLDHAAVFPSDLGPGRIGSFRRGVTD